MTELHYSYRLGISTISAAIREVCTAIWQALQAKCFPLYTEENWNSISKDFEKNANFPNCLGAIDGKHVRLISPNNSGSLYYNYKNFFSIVLLAVCDSNYCFSYIDIGSYGKDCDSTIFKRSSFYKSLQSGNLNIPKPKFLPNESTIEMPFMFVADEAFGLSETVLRPYAGRMLPTKKKRIFNYRLSRARRYIECTFGILSNKWRIFHRPLNVSKDLAIDIVKACCVLHNFVRTRDGHRVHDDTNNSDELQTVANIGRQQGGRGANRIRDMFADYFVSDSGSVSWQNNYI